MTSTTETCSAGHGSSALPLAPRRTRARAGPRARLRRRLPSREVVDDHELGYELMRRFAEVIVSRLQATRMQLLDVYHHDG